MLPQLDQVLLYGWTMLLAYIVILAWTVIFGLHLARPGIRETTVRILWSLCLLALGVALLHGNYHEMRIHRLVLTTSGSVDPVVYATEVYLSRAGSSLLAGCAMIQAILTGWAAFLVKPGGGRE
jgi:hypothetical protein